MHLVLYEERHRLLVEAVLLLNFEGAVQCEGHTCTNKQVFR